MIIRQMETLIQEQTAGIADSLILAFQSYEQALYQIAEEIRSGAPS